MCLKSKENIQQRSKRQDPAYIFIQLFKINNKNQITQLTLFITLHFFRFVPNPVPFEQKPVHQMAVPLHAVFPLELLVAEGTSEPGGLPTLVIEVAVQRRHGRVPLPTLQAREFSH